MNTLEFFFFFFLGGGGGEDGGDESPRWGHSPRMMSGERGLSQILSDKSLS